MIFLDGGGGFGIVVGFVVNECVIEKVCEFGLVWGIVLCLNYFGIVGYYVLWVVELDMIGLVFSNVIV